MMVNPVAPPSLQEITRKLSLHSVAKVLKPPSIPAASGNDSDSDSIASPELTSPPVFASAAGLLAPSTSQPPLSVIAEARAGSGEESEEEDEEGGWRTEQTGKVRRSGDEGVIKTGYLWKKGERRKTWKKRWFVLRPAHLAYYKTSAEYRLLRLLELSEVHSCTSVALKKHAHAFGLVSPTRTFYLYAETQQQVQEWVAAINKAREELEATTTTQSAGSSTPIAIPGRKASLPPIVTPSSMSQSPLSRNITSSESEDASSAPNSYAPSSPTRMMSSPSKTTVGTSGDPTKAVLSGYLMKCGSQRRKWRKRWFTLTGEQLSYSGSHMDPKPHRQIVLAQILDALECEMPPPKQPGATGPTSPPHPGSTSGMEDEEGGSPHMFKIVTTKKTLHLCAPTEEEEIQWLSAVRALIARRGSGMPESGVVAREKTTGFEIQHGQGISGSGSATSGGSSGLKGKVRRLSASGGSAGPSHGRGVSEESSPL